MALKMRERERERERDRLLKSQKLATWQHEEWTNLTAQHGLGIEARGGQPPSPIA